MWRKIKMQGLIQELVSRKHSLSRKRLCASLVNKMLLIIISEEPLVLNVLL